MTIRRTLLRPSKVEYMDYHINHYDGCGHGCRYCWARILRRISYIEWINARPVINALELLDKELPRLKDKVKEKNVRIYICNNTDPYQRIDRRYRLTRKVLQKVMEYNFKIAILTKSNLVLDDLDLFKKYPEIEVGLTLTTHDEKQKALLEPFSSSIQERIDCIKSLKSYGIKTWVNIEPILPYSDPCKIVKTLKNDVDHWVFGQLNYLTIDKQWYAKTGTQLIELANRLKLDYLIKKEFQETIDEYANT